MPPWSCATEAPWNGSRTSPNRARTSGRHCARRSRRSSVAYDTVIHLRTPAVDRGYNRSNPLRTESAAAAAAIDARILAVWANHPRRIIVDLSDAFLDKATRTLDIVRGETSRLLCTARRAAPGRFRRHPRGASHVVSRAWARPVRASGCLPVPI